MQLLRRGLVQDQRKTEELEKDMERQKKEKKGEGQREQSRAQLSPLIMHMFGANYRLVNFISLRSTVGM